MIRAGQQAYIHYSAYNTASNVPELGDAANHTLKLIIDGVISDPTNSPENIAAGECRILLTEAETLGAKFIAVGGISSTPDVSIIPGYVITELLIPGTAFVGVFTAWDVLSNAPKTGDVANFTITVAQNGTSAGATNAPTELSAVNLPGLYALSVTAAEANGKAVSIIGVSATAGVNIIPTELALFNVDYPTEADVRIATDYAEGTLTGTLSPFTASYELPQEIIVEDEEIIIYEGCE